MNRRSWMGIVGGLIGGLLFPRKSKTGPEPDVWKGLVGWRPLRNESEFLTAVRWDAKTGTWRMCEFPNLRPGMICMIEDGEGGWQQSHSGECRFVVKGMPEPCDPPGNWKIEIEEYEG